MKNSPQKYNFWLATILIIAVLIFRVISNQLFIYNFTPVIAVALFAGSKLKDEKYAVLLPIVCLFISDVVLSFLNNFNILHGTLFFTYGALLLIFVLGRFLQKDGINFSQTALYSILSSILFFVLTNFGVWLLGNMYAHNIKGLIECYTLAIPFNKITWIGDLIYVFGLFGVYQWFSVKSTVATR
ncbi:MAG: DUF6580 family putative transport protein [Chitinophagales bacterium]